jgi:hypothetical protein
MNAFSLQMSLVEQGADITSMMKAWMDLSDGKGWPKNEEGWKRYLSRLAQSGAFPRVRAAAHRRSRDFPPPDEFVDWWSKHPDSLGETPASVAWTCQHYQAQWKSVKSGSA